MALHKPNILFVDDEEQNLLAFKSAFRRMYTIYPAKSAREGIEILKKEDIQVILTDQRMPEMTGVEFLASILKEFPDPIRIILTGFSDVVAVIHAINQGEVYRYITKPWNKDELGLTIHDALTTYQLKQENRRLIHQLQEANLNLEAKVKERTFELEKSQAELAEKYEQLAINNQKLSERNQMIDLLLRELNHRVLNNLQVVSAVLDRESESVTDEAVQAIFARIDQRIHEMSHIHQQLMYRNTSGVAIDLGDYFGEIIQILRNLYFPSSKEIDIRLDTSGLRLVQEKAYFLGFIVHELVTNSFKYALPGLENPVLEVSLCQLDPYYCLKVRDNGPGLPDELIHDHELNFELIHSLGLKIIHLIAKLYRGALQVENYGKPGASFEITLLLQEKDESES